MKRLLLAALMTVLLVAISNALAQATGAQSKTKETAVVELVDRTQLLEAVLQGKYLFEHDDERMARGEPCMHIYNYANGKQGDLVIAFHCKPVERPKAKQLVVNVAMTKTPDLFQLTEIQFAGATKGHLVPGA
jgi:uncharacterized cupredoxin-like copper-binding protein